VATPKPVRIIVNPLSGLGQHRWFLENLVAQLEIRRFPVEVQRIAGPGDGRRLAAATPDATTCLVSIGGDGTHREILSGLMGRQVPVCIVPSGTENVLAKTFGLVGTVKETVNLILAGRTVELDIGMAGLKPFVMFSSIGYAAAVTRIVHTKRRGPHYRDSYYSTIGRLWWTYRFPRLNVAVDGRPVAEGAGLVLVANTPLYADRMRVCPHAVADDGLLDVACFPTRTQWELLGHFLRVKLRNHLEDRGVKYVRGKRIEVTSADRDVDIEADGDWITTTPMIYTLRPRAVRMLVRPEVRQQQRPTAAPVGVP